MKKFVQIGTIALAAAMLAACTPNGKTTEPTAKPNETSVPASHTQAPANTKIELSDVNNAPVMSEDDFDCIELDDGGLRINRCLNTRVIISIPETYKSKKITEIGKRAFGSETEIAGVKLPDSITVIGESAFYGCEKLRMVVLGKGVKLIGAGAFQSCYSLESVVLNDGVESIMEYAFGSCKGLTSIKIPESISNIADTAFFGLKDSLTIIGKAGSYAEQYAKEYGFNFKAK